MKKLLLFTFILTLFAGCTSLSDDDYKGLSQKERDALLAEYVNLVPKIVEYRQEVLLKEQKWKDASGGRKIILREQLDEMLEKLREMENRKKEIEKLLEIKV